MRSGHSTDESLLQWPVYAIKLVYLRECDCECHFLGFRIIVGVSQ